MSHFVFEIRSSVSLRRFCKKSREAANTARQSAQIQFQAKKSKDRATSAMSDASGGFQTACEYSGMASFDILTCQRGRARRLRSPPVRTHVAALHSSSSVASCAFLALKMLRMSSATSRATLPTQMTMQLVQASPLANWSAGRRAINANVTRCLHLFCTRAINHAIITNQAGGWPGVAIPT